MTLEISNLSDNDLLRDYARTRSEAAFHQLAARHLDWIYSTALRATRSAALADDVTQAVLFTLSRKAPSLRHHPSLISWLFRATRYAANNLLRAERRRKNYERAAMPPIVDPLPDPEVLRDLDAALARLSAYDRQAILLRFYRQLPHAMVAAALHISEDAARQRVERALQKLRKLLRLKSTVPLIAAFSTSFILAAPKQLMAVSLIAAPQTVLLSKGIESMFILSKMKWAILFVLAVMLPITIGAAVLAARGKGPIVPITTADLAPAVPERSPPSPDYSAVHSYTITTYQISPDGTIPEHLTGQNFFDLDHGTFDKHIFTTATYINRDDGQHAFRYRTGGPFIVQKNSDQPPAMRRKLMTMILEFYRSQLTQRRPEMDLTANNETLFCWESAELVPHSRNRIDQNSLDVWLDSHGLARRAQTTTIDTLFNTTSTSRTEIQCNAPIPPETWILPQNVKVVQPELLLDTQFPLDHAFFAKEALGQTFAIHQLSRDANGILYVIASTRASAATRQRNTRLLDHYSLSLNISSTTNNANIATLASLEAPGIHIKYFALIPSETTGGITAEVSAINADPTAAPATEIIPIDLSVKGTTTSEEFLAATYAAAQSLDGIATATLHQLRRNKKQTLTDVSVTPAELSKEAFLKSMQSRLLEPAIP